MPIRERRALLAVAGAALLATPTVLAFFAGGYFDTPRLWAGLTVWTIVFVAVLSGAPPFPRAGAARAALIGLSLLAAWTLVSVTWAPIAGDAYHAGQRLVVYVGALLAAVAVLRTPVLERAVEPALAAGTLIVIGYGISERMLPGLLHFQHSISAQGRLEQPLTYWNAMGELAAIGLVLAVRLAGDATRDRRLRIAAAAAAAPLGLGLYLSFSRGALFAAAAGLLTLIAATRARAQLRALLVCLSAAVLAALAAAPFAGITALTGARGTRELQGAVMLASLALIMVATATVHARLLRTEPGGELRRVRRLPLITFGLVCAGLALAIIAGAKESTKRPLGGGATRLVTLQSNRYDYWDVALRAFAAQPLRGVGAEGWAVWWLRDRSVDFGAQDAHSLPLQTAAELGIVGLLMLAVFVGGVAVAARDARASAPALAAGPIGGVVAYAAHAPLDWDWQIPAVTLVALVLAGLLLALADQADIRGASPGAPSRLR